MHKSPPRNTLRKIAGLCLDSAKLLMASGAETHRVEETVTHIGNACKMEVDSYVTPTGIIVNVGGEVSVTRLTRVKNRTIDLSKVAAVNAISRALSAGELTLQAASHQIAALAKKAPIYSSACIYHAQALSCMGFALILGGGLHDLLPAYIVGLVARWVDIKFAGLPSFLSVFVNALSVTCFAVLATWCFPSLSVETVIIAGIIPLLPGLSLTNAIADLMAGELIAGMARLTDSILTAAALAGGAAVGISLGQQIL